MTQLEKISAIAGLLVIAASIFAHSISLQGDINKLNKEQQEIKSNIDNNFKKIMDISSYNKSTNNKIKNNEDWIRYLQNRIDERQNSIESSMIKTHQLLNEISKKTQ